MPEHHFVTGVRRELARLGDRQAQDEADFVLLGGTIERKLIVQADCPDCWGTGSVCPCHGIATGCGGSPRERCGCVREAVSASPRNGSSEPQP